MIVAAYRKTMADAKPFIAPKRPTPRRDRLIELSQRWLQTKEGRWQALAEADRRYWRLLVEHSLIPIIEPTSPKEIISRVAFWHGISVEEISDASLHPPRHIYVARHDAIAAIYYNCRCGEKLLSYGQIGRYFGRDRTTIMHSLGLRG